MQPLTNDKLRLAIEEAIARGRVVFPRGSRVLHTEPHADDVMLGYLPVVRKEPVSRHALVVCTSGHRGVPADWPGGGDAETAADVRRQETRRFAESVGIEADGVRFLDLPMYDRGEPTDEDRQAMASLLREVRPDVITLAFDPPSGHATHVAVHQLIAAALGEIREAGGAPPQIIAYRDVWARFEIGEATHIVPVSDDDMRDLESAFADCYPSQAEQGRRAGKDFAAEVCETWRTQLADVRNALGESADALPANTAGVILLRELTLEELRCHD